MTERAALFFLVPFSAALLALVAANLRPLFLRRHGRAHRLLGLLLLAWLALGLVDAVYFKSPPHVALCYDLWLFCLGYVVTMSAARAFPHPKADNGGASGALDRSARVTRAEMVEHSFYQLLNGAQAVYLHALPHVRAPWRRLALCLLATSPWAVRHLYPVHAFSANYGQGGAWRPEALLYWLKKRQYLLWKHALLHGLNLSLALKSSPIPAFRLYWVCLNAAYVLEFFLQTLVARGRLTQTRMLCLNALLMAASTLAALPVLARVRPPLAAASLGLNLVRRRRDVSNTTLLGVVAFVVVTKLVTRL